MREPTWRRECIYHLSWERLDALCTSLYQRIGADGFEPDIIVAIARGGLVPGVRLSHLFSVEAFEVATIQKNLTSERYSARGRAVVKAFSQLMRDGRVLVVDDIVGSGDTLRVACQALDIPPERLRTAALFVNDSCETPPDYYERRVDDWVVFPWEMPPAALVGDSCSDLPIQHL
jgi:hypoxanthine phosphoribosyltransferase